MQLGDMGILENPVNPHSPGLLFCIASLETFRQGGGGVLNVVLSDL
ncbi:hypothetical protein [Anabaena sp. CCY 9614]